MSEDVDTVKDNMREAARKSVKVNQLGSMDDSLALPETERDLIQAPEANVAINEPALDPEPVVEAKNNLASHQVVTMLSKKGGSDSEKVTEAEAPTAPGEASAQVEERISLRELYKYSSAWDKFLVYLGIVMSFLAGVTQPMFAIVMSRIFFIMDPTIGPEESREIMQDIMVYCIVISVAMFVTSYLSYACLQVASERLSYELRARYLASLMRQEIAFFESQQVEALPSKMAEYFTNISEGIGEKLGQVLNSLGATLTGMILGLVINPKIGFLLLIYMPFSLFFMAMFGGKMMRAAIEKMTENGKLGGFTEEMLSSLKLIISFGKEQLKLEEYKKLADEAYKVGRSAAYLSGSMGGIFFGVMMGFPCYAWVIGFFAIRDEWYNPTMDRTVNVEDIVVTYQTMMFGMFTTLGLLGLLPAVNRALVTGKLVMDVIDREPIIRSLQSGAQKEIKIEEGIMFNNVAFKYPSAHDSAKNVFDDVSFTIKAGTSTAIVGPSGSGKSTIVQMLNRFYDPKAGSIQYGKTQLKDIDLTTLRESIGWVGQEPVLVVGTIQENLHYGNKDASKTDIERALRQANAETFINGLEKGIDTYVGSGTVLNLSGGQKQRIAIARALLKKPQILVLDEATSALDPKSEAEVQNAIMNIQHEQRGELTIIMIAHRLSTIQTADNLLYLESPTSVLAASKGTPEYQQLMQRLKETNYAHQNDDYGDEGSVDSDESEEIVVDQHIPLPDGSALDISHHSATPRNSARKRVSERLALPEPELGKKRSSKRESHAVKRVSKSHTKQPANSTSKGEIKVMTQFKSKSAGWGRLFSYYRPHWMAALMFLLGFIVSLFMPFIGLCIINLQNAMYMKKTDPENWQALAIMWILLFIALIITIMVFVSLEKVSFALMGEKLTHRIRCQLIEEIMHKQISWFDREDRAPGILTQILSSDVTSLNGMTTETLVSMFEVLFTFTFAVVLGTIWCWQATVLCFVLSPIMIVCMYFQATMQWGKKGGKLKHEQIKVDDYEKANALLSDVIVNYRTVISFGQKNVDMLNAKFQELLCDSLNNITKKQNRAGIASGLANSGRLIYVGIIFYFAFEVLIYRLNIEKWRVVFSTFMLFFSFMGIGGQTSNIPSIQKAKASAIPIFSIIDEVSELDVRKGGRPITEVAEGKIEFKGTHFNYPTRAQKVMDDFYLTIPAGAKIALVGHSGCGKSTLTNLLLRFYNVSSGEILIDGRPLDEYDVLRLRESCGYVMQEPVLFNSDIKTNILFGKPDATDEEVYLAAQKANALGFIEASVDADDDAIREKLLTDFQSAFASKRSEFPGIADLQTRFQDSSDEQKQILIDLLNSVDASLLAKANADLPAFSKALNTALSGYGASWCDAVIQFEWAQEFHEALKDETLPQERRSQAQKIVDHGNMNGQFDISLLRNWCRETTELSQPEAQKVFVEMVQKKASAYKQEMFARLEVLQKAAIASMRGPDGVFKLHEGFKKDCGLKGGKLSGGQKQRIAIARALIKNPRILILDEATSALDEKSQEVVQQALDRAMEGRTSIVIAHRLSTIRNCDILFVLGEGKVLEQGTFDELSANPESHFNYLKAGMEN